MKLKITYYDPQNYYTSYTDTVHYEISYTLYTLPPNL